MRVGNLISFIKKPRRVVLVLAAFFIVAGGYWFLGRGSTQKADFVLVGRGDVRQEISVTGRVKPAEDVDLAFETSGRVSRVLVRVGDTVEPGRVLLELGHGDLAADLKQAEAGVLVARARLGELRGGTRPEEIKVAEVKVVNAKTAVEDREAALQNQMQDAYTKSDDAIRNKVDQFMTNPKSSNPKLTFQADLQSASDTEFMRMTIENLLKNWASRAGSIDSKTVRSNLNQIQKFLDTVAPVINNLSTMTNLTQTTVDKYKTDIATARTNINTAIENLAAADEKLRSAQASLALAEEELKLKKAGTVPEQIASQEAEIARAEASVESIRAKNAKTTLRAPIAGVVTKQDARVGEIISPNTPIVSLISASQYEIEAHLPEADIAKVALGQEAHVTLDAYGSDTVFNAKVVTIDPAETIIDGVSTYKITLQFLQNDTRVRSGMTANIDIVGEMRTSVLFVPQRTIVTRNGDKTVQILDGEVSRSVSIKIGLRGSDGSVEILEGVREGDKVLTVPEIK